MDCRSLLKLFFPSPSFTFERKKKKKISRDNEPWPMDVGYERGHRKESQNYSGKWPEIIVRPLCKFTKQTVALQLEILGFGVNIACHWLACHSSLPRSSRMLFTFSIGHVGGLWAKDYENSIAEGYFYIDFYRLILGRIEF